MNSTSILSAAWTTCAAVRILPLLNNTPEPSPGELTNIVCGTGRIFFSTVLMTTTEGSTRLIASRRFCAVASIGQANVTMNVKQIQVNLCLNTLMNPPMKLWSRQSDRWGRLDCQSGPPSRSGFWHALGHARVTKIFADNHN